MRQGDVSFASLSKWLKQLEETVSPYKRYVLLKFLRNQSPKAIKLIENLGKRAKAMQIEPLVSISEEQCKNLFENWDDFKYWLMFYNVDSLENF